jgi:hypothetical protein
VFVVIGVGYWYAKPGTFSFIFHIDKYLSVSIFVLSPQIPTINLLKAQLKEDKRGKLILGESKADRRHWRHIYTNIVVYSIPAIAKLETISPTVAAWPIYTYN